ncbi:MAG: response regulator [Acidobacteriota bacterium]
MDTGEWKILLVDDEVEFISTLIERLALRGIRAQAANSGEEALVRIEEDPPQVVVLDKMMPGMGGTEVLRRIKRNRPEVQVIFLTGQGCTIEENERATLGAFDCLVKPFDLNELIGIMRSAVDAYHSAKK